MMPIRSCRIGFIAVTAAVSLVQACGPDDGGVSARTGGPSSTPAGTGGAAIGSGSAGTGGSSMTGQGSGTAGAPGGVGSAGADSSGGTAGTGAVGAGGAPDSGGAVDAGRATDASGAADAPVHLDDTLRARVVAGIVPLQAWYNTSTGLFDRNDWWTSGNQLEAVIDYTREIGDMKYFADIDNTFEKNKGNNFDKWGFYDDDGWWAIVWIKAYDLTKQQKYLDMSKTIFKRMAGSWDTKCGGGIYWRNAKDKKNAIPNTLFMQAAAKLHIRTPGDTGTNSYIDYAQRTWAWFKASGLLQSSKLIFDTLNNLTNCKAEGPVFTYNQGVAVGALVDLAAASGDATLLDEAGAIARATMSLMQVNGILKEAPCGGETCTQFKGVFFRNVLTFYRVRPALDLQMYMRRQSDQIWNVSRDAQNHFGYEWHLPFDGASVMRQASALDALEAAYAASSPLP